MRERPTGELEAILLAWAKIFQRLVMDNTRWGACYLFFRGFLQACIVPSPPAMLCTAALCLALAPG